MITKRVSITLGVATATVSVALLAPVLGATAGGGGGAAAVRMVRFPRDRTIIRLESIRHRGQAVVAAATEAMACLQAPVPEAVANHPDDSG
jgi:hypothetical protein